LKTGPGVPRWFKRFQFRLANRLLIEPLVAREVNRFRQELGLARERSVFFFGDWWHSPQKVLGLFPDWYAPPQPDWPASTVLTGFPLWDESGLTEMPPALGSFLDSGTPPIVFAPGSAMKHGHDFFAAAAQACQQLGRRGILLTRYAEQIPAKLPEGVRHFEFVPFSLLLPRAAALVHHGGIGTASQALAAGVPQLVMPMAHDQPDNAARLRRLGVATSLPPAKFVAASVARELGTLLNSPRTLECCRQVASRFATQGGIGRACDEIEALL
jgi:UDP:flavonoid glycosyltransferase YjiC (YdhE family)